jgi:hypothetical protein
MEARVGIEPTDEGFADLSLTTWVPRQTHSISKLYWRHRRIESELKEMEFATTRSTDAAFIAFLSA